MTTEEEKTSINRQSNQVMEARESLIHMASRPQKYELEPYKFKGKIFFEFLSYFILSSVLGPLSYFLFIKFIQNGRVLAKNLHVYGGKEEWWRTFLWILKVYCYATNFLITPSSTSQFVMLIYTEISLCVLYAAYYCSYSDTEIERFRNEVYDPGENIFDKLLQLIQVGKQSFFERENLNQVFPEIDVDNFYFIFPPEAKSKIPAVLEAKPLESKANAFKPLKTGFIVAGEKYASYLADQSGYKNFNLKIAFIKTLAKFLVALRLLIPILMNLYTYVYCEYEFIIYENGELPAKVKNYCIDINPNIAVGALYIFQQIFFTGLLYRFVTVYYVLFLGLLLYFKKMDLLLKLSDSVRLRTSNRNEFKINMNVPQNIQNWYNIRRVFSELNKQVFVVVDVNMSFILLYLLFFIFIILIVSFGIVSDVGFFNDISVLFKTPELLSVTVFYMLTLVIVIMIDMGLVVYLNLLYTYDTADFNYYLGIMQTMVINSQFYIKKKVQSSEGGEIDLYKKNILEIKSFLGQDFEELFYGYAKRLRDSTNMVITNLLFELNYRPNTLLGIKADVRLVISLITAFSALGLSSLQQIINAINDSFSISKNKVFKSRRARLKKTFHDLCTTAAYLNYDLFQKALKTNKILLSNTKQAKQFFQVAGNRISIESIMQMIDFRDETDSHEISAKLEIPEKYRPYLETEESKKDTEQVPRPPVRPMTNVQFKRNHVPTNTTLQNATEEDEKTPVHTSMQLPTEPGEPNTTDFNKSARQRAMSSVHKSYGHFASPDETALKASAEKLLSDIPSNEKEAPRRIIEYRSKPITKGLSIDERVLDLVHDMQAGMVEYKYVFDLLKATMQMLGEDYQGQISRSLFESKTRQLRATIGPVYYERILDLSTNEEGALECGVMGRIVDLYKYSPALTKKFKNSSEQFQKMALFGGSQPNDSVTYKNYKILGYKIEEKFDEMRKAYRFFDFEKAGHISFSDFKAGLDLLQLRIPDNEVKALFYFLDRQKDGFIDYDEFCDILEERKLFKGTPGGETDPLTGKEKKPRPPSSRDANLLVAKLKEDPRFTDYLRENSISSSVISEAHEKSIQGNRLLQKTPVGSVKRWGYDLPSDSDGGFRYGLKSRPTEKMRDIMSNNYQKEWIDVQRENEQKRRDKESKESTREKKVLTQASILRNEFVKKILEKQNSRNSEEGWKMTKFSRAGSRVSSRRGSIQGLNSSFTHKIRPASANINVVRKLNNSHY